MSTKCIAKAAKEQPLNDDNFRAFAQQAIAKYEEKNMVIDALLWSAIIARYEKALERAKK